MTELLVRVVCDGSKPFVAGAIVRDEKCVHSAPILRRHVMGRTADEMRAVFRRYGWRASIVGPSPLCSGGGR